MEPFVHVVRVYTAHSYVCIGAQARGFSCWVTQSRQMVSKCLLWAGPCLWPVCVCKLDCFLLFVHPQRALAEPLSLPGQPQRIVIHSLHPPLTWSSQARAQERNGSLFFWGVDPDNGDPGQILLDSLSGLHGNIFGPEH